MSTDQQEVTARSWVHDIKAQRYALTVICVPPQGWVRFAPEVRHRLRDVRAGEHLIAIDGKWCPVTEATHDDDLDLSQIITPPGYPCVDASNRDVPVKLCRRGSERKWPYA